MYVPWKTESFEEKKTATVFQKCFLLLKSCHYGAKVLLGQNQ